MSATSLPVSVHPLIGRERETEHLLKLLNDPLTRLLTLTGPGGVGKTRLALEVVDNIADQGDYEVTVVSLAALSDPELVAPTIGQSFGLSDTDAHSLPERLSFALADRHVLLMLDNYEQLLPAAPLLSMLLIASPTLKLLVTSRVLLRLTMEKEFVVAPLELPDPDDMPGRNATHPALQLFLRRASRNWDNLSLEERAAVEGICRRADGLPLAIELAAAKTRLLTLPELLRRMDHALPLLVDGPRDAPARLRTMRNAIAWSFDLLTPDEQDFFCALSVFTGGFTIESAECVAQPNDEFDTLTGLQLLMDHSLIRRVESSDGHQRFSMLETLREFGQEKLISGGDDYKTRGKHATWFANQLELPELDNWDTATLRHFSFPGDHDNIRTALRWGIAQGEAINAAKLTLSMWPFWWKQGFFSEGRATIAAVMAIPASLPSVLRSTLIATAAEFAFHQSDFETSGVLAAEGVEIAKALEDTDRLRLHLFQSNWSKVVLDPYSALAPVEELVALCRALEDGEATVRALYCLAMTNVYIDQLPQAVTCAIEAQSIVDSLEGEHDNLAAEINGLRGSLALYSEDYEVAESLLAQTLAIRRKQGNKVREISCLRDLGRIALERGDMSNAASNFAEALELAYLVGSEHVKCYCYVEVAAVSRDPEASAALLGAEANLRHRIKLSNIPSERILRDRTITRVKSALGNARFDTGFAAGKSMTSMEAYKVARHALTTVLDRPAKPDSLLTRREREVLVLISKGKSDREIGELLFISPRTAASHAGNVLAKLGVHSRAEATAWAVRNNVA